LVLISFSTFCHRLCAGWHWQKVEKEIKTKNRVEKTEN